MSDTTDHLSLYQFDGCPWCERVRIAIDDLGLEVEQRDVRRDGAHAEALQRAIGRSTVPVLRIDGAHGARWLPESADIVRHLYAEYGQGRDAAWFATGAPQRLGAVVAVLVAIAALFAPDPARWWLLVAAVVVWGGRNYAPWLARRVPGRR